MRREISMSTPPAARMRLPLTVLLWVERLKIPVMAAPSPAGRCRSRFPHKKPGAEGDQRMSLAGAAGEGGTNGEAVGGVRETTPRSWNKCQVQFKGGHTRSAGEGRSASRCARGSSWGISA